MARSTVHSLSGSSVSVIEDEDKFTQMVVGTSHLLDESKDPKSDLLILILSKQTSFQ
ncbi:hypothetical protein NG791_28835 [Laspinema sp. D1]|uniref:hypothetical protein n=1 Tax=Laspinema palackyanum TaxID=3231601 RepID=UPI00346B43A0|nr:hypothetical protein [Laspinema sp. D2b]